MATAQGVGNVYAAPGMPVRVSGPVAAPALRLARKAIAPAVKKTAATPVMPPIASPIFPRFWRMAVPARQQVRQQYYHFQQQHIKYPATSLRAGVGGRVWALLTVLPDGKVGAVRIVHRVLDEAVASVDAPTPAAEAALDAEVIRVVSQMRFEPAAVAEDTVTVIQRFAFQ